MAIVDNLHDLYCKGNKDVKEALANVQDYNLAKILSRKCAFPDKSGDIKEARLIFNILYAIQMDVEMYNYIDVLFHDHRGKGLPKKVERDRFYNEK
jgi:hypothetical protein